MENERADNKEEREKMVDKKEVKRERIRKTEGTS